MEIRLFSECIKTIEKILKIDTLANNKIRNILKILEKIYKNIFSFHGFFSSSDVPGFK